VPAIDPALINVELASEGKVSAEGKVQSNQPDEPVVLAEGQVQISPSRAASVKGKATIVAADKISKNDSDLQQQDHAAPSGGEHLAVPSQGGEVG